MLWFVVMLLLQVRSKSVVIFIFSNLFPKSESWWVQFKTWSNFNCNSNVLLYRVSVGGHAGADWVSLRGWGGIDTAECHMLLHIRNVNFFIRADWFVNYWFWQIYFLHFLEILMYFFKLRIAVCQLNALVVLLT